MTNRFRVIVLLACAMLVAFVLVPITSVRADNIVPPIPITPTLTSPPIDP
jgi:hypothetical protein